jgi:HEAT repeat protein
LKDATSAVRWAAVAAVGKLAGPHAAPDVISALIPLLQDEDRYVRSATVSVLAECRHPSLVEPFVERLKDWNEWIRRTAAFALGDWGDPRAVDGLTALLDDPEAKVQQEAQAALEKLGATTSPPTKNNKHGQDAGKTARKVKSHKKK